MFLNDVKLGRPRGSNGRYARTRILNADLEVAVCKPILENSAPCSSALLCFSFTQAENLVTGGGEVQIRGPGASTLSLPFA